MELSWSEKSEYIGIVGRRGENETRILTFDCTSALKEHPEAEILCIMQRPGDAQPYTHDYTQDGDTITVALTAADMCRVGTLKLELRLMQNEKILKSAIYRGGIALSLHYGEPECGEAVDLLNRIDKTLKDATETAARLETSLDGVDDAIDRLDAATGSATATDKQAQENEKTRGEAEKERVEAENGRILAENSRQQQENERADAEFIRSQNERSRYGNENQRIINESERTRAETARNTAESSRVASENTRVQAESERVKAETSRAEAEQSRLSAEEARVSAEKARTAAEDLRVQQEQRRETAETSRTEAERQRESMETSRQTAETTRNAAENGRAKAEKARETAESQRQQAETARADAESKRVQAEQGRVTAEQGRVEAEVQREEAMAQHAEKIAELEEEVAKKAQIDDATVSGSEAWSSQHIVDMLCPPLEESGNPVVCYPVAGSKLGVTASWEPTQEGEGTPYPAGGGPNLLDISQCTATVGKPYGVTVTIDEDIIKVSGIPSSEVTEERVYSFGIVSCAQTDLRGKGYKVTPFAIRGKVSSAWGLRTEDESSLAISAKLTPDVNTDIQLRLMVSKDTPTAYAPYANIRPISGRDSVAIERLGENLLNISQLKPNGYNLAGSNTLKPNTTYTFKPVSCGGINFAIFLADNIIPSQTTKQLELTGYIEEGKSATFTTPSNAGSYSIMWLAGSKSGIHQVYPNVQFMLVAGTTAPTTYSPYSGSTTMLTLPSIISGGEVGADGEGHETWKLLTLTGEEQWNYESNAYFVGHRVLNNVPVETDGKCSHFIYHYNYGGDCIFCTGDSVYTGPQLTAKYTDVNAWKAYLAAQHAAGTPVQIAYKLATPVPFTATGGGAIKALSGTNTVITDADALTVKGRADPIHIIQQLQAASAASAQALADVERAVTDI
mgnify:CR=1 FL=1